MLKIAVLCNNKMAMPALQYMLGAGVVCTVATADKDPEAISRFGSVARHAGVPYCKMTRVGFAAQIYKWVTDTTPDVVFVMTFPWRVPADVLALPKWGFVNFHYGLLPEMRGADPIFESIRLRKPVAGTTVHLMDAGLDTGPIIYREQMPLPPEFTYGMLSGQMALLGDRMCQRLVAELKNGAMPAAIPQDEAKAAYLPKIKEEEINISWVDMDIADIMALVRGCNPVTKGAQTAVNGWVIGICDVSEVSLQGDASAILPGTILAIDAQNGLIVCCRGGKAVKLETVYIAEGIFPGYKLALFGITVGMIFG